MFQNQHFFVHPEALCKIPVVRNEIVGLQVFTISTSLTSCFHVGLAVERKRELLVARHVTEVTLTLVLL